MTTFFNVDGMLLRAGIAAMLLGLAACGGGGGGGEETQPLPPLQPTLASIQANIFTPTCASPGANCHGTAMAQQGLRLEDGFSRMSLVDVTSSQFPMYKRVDPGMPDVSLLILKLEGAPNIGDQMPADGNYLQAATIQVIKEWILNGALP